tara:strand:- start:135062 stop:136894 length:1833 start_codon:yes stop_codon:yes gene_type:complete
MCGITALVSQRDIAPLLVEGLKRLEYRGYDSAGLAVLGADGELIRRRVCGKVRDLDDALSKAPALGKIGLAHTRWATHGQPSEINAHPHTFEDSIALVHNGIIENFETLRAELIEKGHRFESETDSEVIVCLLGDLLKLGCSLKEAVQEAMDRLEGTYALCVVSKAEPDHIIVARKGSPLVLGVGIGEHYIASDTLALLPFTQEIVVLEEGDIADVYQHKFEIFDASGKLSQRPVKKISISLQSVDRGSYRHFMQKEIFEQPQAVCAAMEGRLSGEDIHDRIFGSCASDIFDRVRHVQIVACGTSYHAGLVAKSWIESITGLSCQVDVASEVRYQRQVVPNGTLFVSLSQSGETADTLAALKGISSDCYCGTLAICNVPESALVRESQCVLLTHAGPEIGVASTKAFTTQLVALLMLTHCLGKRNDQIKTREAGIAKQLRKLPALLEETLKLDSIIERYSERFEEKNHTLFLGRGKQYAIAKEGALKLKEISYIHAEAYPAGELKHGPLALVDKHMPVVVVASKDSMLEKLKSNIHEVLARKGEVFLIAEKSVAFTAKQNMTVIEVPDAGELLSPIVMTLPLQQLAYHVALRKGTDVDQPRNLAKSVTVE